MQGGGEKWINMLPLSCLIQPNTDDIDLVEGSVSSKLPSGKNMTYIQQSDRIQNLIPEIDEIDVYVC